jgi:hypothetical protein
MKKTTASCGCLFGQYNIGTGHVTIAKIDFLNGQVFVAFDVVADGARKTFTGFVKIAEVSEVYAEIVDQAFAKVSADLELWLSTVRHMAAWKDLCGTRVFAK